MSKKNPQEAISQDDERRVEAFLRSRNLNPTRFSKQEKKRYGKTPDYKVDGPNDAFFFLEVKSILTETGPEVILHSTKHGSLTDNIHEAVKQFRSVNNTRSAPNVLVWCSHNMQINFQDLRDLVGGGIVIDGVLCADLRKYRFGRVSSDLPDIDLHLWLDDDTPQYLFIDEMPHLLGQLRRSFPIVS